MSDTSKILVSYDGNRFYLHNRGSVAASLIASGNLIFSRSQKYHRPRGLLCGTGQCPSCLMTINGIPNERACEINTKHGLLIRTQNNYPSAKHDLFSLLDHIGLLFPIGFQYKILRPQYIHKIFQFLLSKFSGLANPPTEKAVYQVHSHVNTKRTDIVVIGGGPAGTSAAYNASRFIKKVTLIDENRTLCEKLNHPPIDKTVQIKDARHRQSKVEALTSKILKTPNIDLMLNCQVIGIYGKGVLGIVSNREKFIELHAKKLLSRQEATKDSSFLIITICLELCYPLDF